MRCPACGGETLTPAVRGGVDRLHRTPGEFEVLRCAACATGVTRPAAGPEELAGFYPSGYGPYQTPPGRLARLISAAIRRLQALAGRAGHAARPSSRSASGAGHRRGMRARRHGGRARGPRMAGHGRRALGRRLRGCPEPRGGRARGNTRRRAARPGHLLGGRVPALARARRRSGVRPAHRRDSAPAGGLVSITVPNFGSWQARRFGSRWFHLDLPRHRVHFTRGGTAGRARTGRARGDSRSHHEQLDRPAGEHPVRAGRTLPVSRGDGDCAWPAACARSPIPCASWPIARRGLGTCFRPWPAGRAERSRARPPAPRAGREPGRRRDWTPASCSIVPRPSRTRRRSAARIWSESPGGTVTPVPVSWMIRAASLPLARARIGRPAPRYSKSLPVASPRLDGAVIRSSASACRWAARAACSRNGAGQTHETVDPQGAARAPRARR